MTKPLLIYQKPLNRYYNNFKTNRHYSTANKCLSCGKIKLQSFKFCKLFGYIMSVVRQVKSVYLKILTHWRAIESHVNVLVVEPGAATTTCSNMSHAIKAFTRTFILSLSFSTEMETATTCGAASSSSSSSDILDPAAKRSPQVRPCQRPTCRLEIYEEDRAGMGAEVGNVPCSLFQSLVVMQSECRAKNCTTSQLSS